MSREEFARLSIGDRIVTLDLPGWPDNRWVCATVQDITKLDADDARVWCQLEGAEPSSWAIRFPGEVRTPEEHVKITLAT